ncbi:uncharacterized protein LOC105423610 [Pogonomyrmex barbatus]|uniref:Uncharacterized protein LOC105423610 n=1 Tax=Pogonomyrmex barbatus TaxID=144034 RepID=A0A6I9VXB5_9HYME|nr:uncharacterized protein LOC105423610 [Pogonomyrmex barbatus]
MGVLRILFGRDLSLHRVWTIQCNSEYSTNYYGYMGLSDKNAVQWIFLNHKPIRCPLILKLIKVAFKEKLGLSSNRESNAPDSYDKNMFILLFLTFSQKEFTYVTENAKCYVMFYDIQKILNTVKNCTFECLAEEATISFLPVVTPYLHKTPFLRQTYTKEIERSVFNNNINGRKKIVMIKRKKITSTIVTDCFNKQHNRSDNVKTINYYTDKKNGILSSLHCRTNITCKRTSVKYKNFGEARKKVHNNVDNAQTSFINFDITDNFNFPKSDKAHDYRNDNNNDSANMISPLSEWSNWTYYTKKGKGEAMRNSHDILSENNARIQRLFEFKNQFDFLPRKLHGLLQHRHVKLTNVKCFNSPNDTIPFTENWQYEHAAVHPCQLKQKLCEFRLSRASLKCIKIINQVNDEFIAAWMTYDGRKILLMIDQHAVHERIRYENLLFGEH